MTRLNDRLVVQRVDDLLVIMDESAGAEIVFDPEMRGRLVETITYLFSAEGGSRAAVLEALTEVQRDPTKIDRMIRRLRT